MVILYILILLILVFTIYLEVKELKNKPTKTVDELIDEEINNKIKKICNIRYNQKLSSNHRLEYKINTNMPIFDSPADNNKLKELTNFRKEIYII